MSYIDLRDWLEAVDRQGELKRINGASWDLEMSTITELVYREGKDPKPALLFDEIPGYPKGFRTLFGMLGSTWRIAKTLGLPEDQTNHSSVLQNWNQKVKSIQPIPPAFVSSAPVLANSLTGDEIDVVKFPVPRFHELDGGRYIGTCHAVIQKDPDTGWVNLGTYRNMIVASDRIALHATTGKHGNIIEYEKYFARGQAMPIAIAIGFDPVLFWLSCQPTTPWGVSEYDVAGGIKGMPIEVVEGPYTGLPLPARAEIVIEGECRPGEIVDEGPFGEWHGYYANQGLSPVLEPVIRVKAVHYRDDPILTCSAPAVPPWDHSLVYAMGHSAGIREHLESFGIPGIKGVWCHEVGGGLLFNVIAIEQLYAGHATQVGTIAALFNTEIGRYTVVVEDDIDPSDLNQVIWAVVTRALPDKSIHLITDCHSYNGDPAIPYQEKVKAGSRGPLTTARVFINACRDLSWKADWYPIARVSSKLRAEIIEKWKSALL